MDRLETLKIMAVLRGAYPRYYASVSREDLETVVALWVEMFSEEPYEIVAAAVKALIVGDVKGFPPHIGAVKERIHQLTQPHEMTELEAWGYVAKAVRNSLYNSREEFEKLPPLVQRLVGSPNQLRTWAMIDTDSLETVVQSNFMRSFKNRAQSVKDHEKLPASVKAIAGRLSTGMQMPELPAAEWEEPYDNHEL